MHLTNYLTGLQIGAGQALFTLSLLLYLSQ